ncbi:MAG: xanthine dehydrogenase family Fe-S subunit [Burkholderiales bacterium]
MNKKIQLTVNGKAVGAEVEPRLQLADFLREHLLLTGTHLGCEHGVCGACTIELDGAPARSCIAYAVTCDGADVRTIEDFDDDSVMAQLREAFSAEHALQCGYCTPGMLITARDIVTRLPHADEARIRKELAGNLCRCTGYVGIVRAIQKVIAAPGSDSSPRAESAGTASVTANSARTEDKRQRSVSPDRSLYGPTLKLNGEGAESKPATALEGSHEAPALPGTAKPITEVPAAGRQQTTMHQSFSIDHPVAKVWAFFGRLDEIALCLPGTSLRGMRTDDHVDTRIRIKVGPIVAEFEGSADAVRDPSNHSGTIHGSARDARSSSTTRGEIRYVLLDEKGGAATRVEVDVGFTLTGPLAQFSRSSIVQDIAKRMTAAFAQNLEARLNQSSPTPNAGRAKTAPAAELNAGSLVVSVLWNRIRDFLRSLLRR